jgi:hypothetical protein
MSFRAQREILRLYRIKNRRFLPVVETTDSLNTTFYEAINLDELVKSRQIAFSVIPAEAGIQSFQAVLDPGVRRGDDLKDFLRLRQPSLDT